MKMTLPVPFIYICCTHISTWWTKPNDAGLFYWRITIWKRANYVEEAICLFTEQWDVVSAASWHYTQGCYSDAVTFTSFAPGLCRLSTILHTPHCSTLHTVPHCSTLQTVTSVWTPGQEDTVQDRRGLGGTQPGCFIVTSLFSDVDILDKTRKYLLTHN